MTHFSPAATEQKNREASRKAKADKAELDAQKVNSFAILESIEKMGYTWDMGWRGKADIEVRIWDFPSVISREKCSDIDGLIDALIKAFNRVLFMEAESE